VEASVRHKSHRKALRRKGVDRRRQIETDPALRLEATVDLTIVNRDVVDAVRTRPTIIRPNPEDIGGFLNAFPGSFAPQNYYSGRPVRSALRH
jgi:hypothetical protein